MYLSQNLKYLRQQFNYSQQQAAELLGIPRTTLGDYERGHTEPNTDMLVKISKLYTVNIDNLINRKLELEQWEEIIAPGVKILAITTDSNKKGNIELVNTKAAAGYMESFQDPEFVSELPKLYMPALQGHYRAFEIEGDSMLPMESGSIVICKYTESLQQIKDNKTYIVVSKQDGIVYKRLQANHNRKYLNCISDNTIYPVFNLPYEEVKEVWEYHAHISFSQPKEIYEYWMQEQLDDIQKKVTALHQHYVGKVNN